MNDFWNGTLVDWLVGVGTLALAVFAFVQILGDRAAKAQLRRDLADERRKSEVAALAASEADALRVRRAQAEQVVVWNQTGVAQSGFEILQDPGRPQLLGTAAIVLNDSSLPITNVAIEWRVLVGDEFLEGRTIQTIPPRSLRGWYLPDRLREDGVEFVLEMTFFDAQGRLWRRSRFGEVTEPY